MFCYFVNLFISLFVLEKKNVLSFTEVMSSLDSMCQNKYSLQELQEQIECLVELAPEWCTINTLPEVGKTVKLNKKINFVDIRNKIMDVKNSVKNQ